MYINEYGEREADWYEVKRFLPLSEDPTGSKSEGLTTHHRTRTQANKARAEALKSGKYEAVYIDHIAENSGIID